MFDAMGEREISLALQKTETTIIKSEREGIISFVLSRFHPSASLTTEYNDNIFLLQANPKGDIINTLDAGVLFSLGRGKRFFTSTEENKLDLFIGTKAVAYADNTRLDDYYPYAVLSSQFGKGRHKFTLDQLYKEYFSRTSLLTTGTGGMSYY